MELFSEEVYLRDYKQQYQISITLPYQAPDYHERQTLTSEEIAELFAFTDFKVWKMRYPDFYRQRNQAMLCIYYCCGLRKSEGVNLEVKDIQSDRLTIHVSKGKGSRGRYVPTTLQTHASVNRLPAWGKEKETTAKQQSNREFFYYRIRYAL